MAAREMGGLSLADALLLCELLANVDPARYERAALRWLQRFIDERLPPLSEVALAASALANFVTETGARRRRAETLASPWVGTWENEAAHRRPVRHLVRLRLSSTASRWRGV